MRLRLATSTDCSALAHLHVTGWQTTYRGIISDAYLDGLHESDRIALWTAETAQAAGDPRRLILLAETEASEPVAFAASGPERLGNTTFPGEIYAIYILPDHRRQGLGRQLMIHSARHLIAHGMPAMLLWALERNPACRFYDALGGLLVNQRLVSIGGAELAEVAFGWSDLTQLAQSDTPRI